MLKIAIVDDVNEVCSQAERYIEKACGDFQLEFEIDIYNSGEGIIRQLSDGVLYHIIFLDIELSCCNGIDVSRFIREDISDNSVQIVYISGKNGYDRQMFEFRPFHFIPKPIDEEKIAHIISKYMRIYGNKSDIFHYKRGHDTYFARISNILYFESSDRKVVIKTDVGEESFYGSLNKVQEQLKNQGFIMLHKSYLVNYSFIKSFRPDHLLMTNGQQIPIAKSKKREISRLQLILENGGTMR